ncbi:hypothetical protein GZ77_03530 [Endozoicomonas montiporae]|uniref:Uncharacterized protein n=1 Tax=Endozoicomonas montiporae TaxID=1027273 RepID=A0A081NB41_9GAMM|nr:hypothetical protein GZ77_03530 [Endozoicomonas montiporae]
MAGEALKGAKGGSAGQSSAGGSANSGAINFGAVNFGNSTNDTIIKVVVVAAVALWLIKKKK